MTIRALDKKNIKEIEAVNNLAYKYEIDVPIDATIIVAIDENDEVKAFVGLRPIINITPFVSNNPMIGKKLFDHAISYMKDNNCPLVQCVTDPKNEALFKKLEFSKIYDGKIIMERLL
jgi:citrate lyase synthetase